jgi:hypothetical protein
MKKLLIRIQNISKEHPVAARPLKTAAVSCIATYPEGPRQVKIKKHTLAESQTV